MSLVKVTAVDDRVKKTEANKPDPTSVRLVNAAPIHFTVGANDQLKAFLDNVVAKVGQDKIGMLSIYAHSINDFDMTSDQRSRSDLKYNAGYGVKFCKQDICLDTVEQFGILKPLFAPGSMIELVCCALVTKSPDYVGSITGRHYRGDGIALCKQLANVTGARVRAARNPQDYRSDKNYDAKNGVQSIDFGEWEGPVFVFEPGGGINRDLATEKRNDADREKEHSRRRRNRIIRLGLFGPIELFLGD